jgi:hypothetical protein
VRLPPAQRLRLKSSSRRVRSFDGCCYRLAALLGHGDG